MRIGVVADTHVGEHLAALPAEVAEALGDVDLILHAGDVCSPGVLEELGRLAPVVAVRGNHDRGPGLDDLPTRALVRAGGARIGLTHGTRPPGVEVPAVAASLVTGRPCLLGFERAMARRFRDVDCVVVGHLHLPLHRRVGGALVFSPGAVWVPEGDEGGPPPGLRERAYLRTRRRLPPDARLASVGVIEVGRGGLRARVVPLRRAQRGAAR